MTCLSGSLTGDMIIEDELLNVDGCVAVDSITRLISYSSRIHTLQKIMFFFINLDSHGK
jgi:hypothetical protein